MTDTSIQKDKKSKVKNAAAMGDYHFGKKMKKQIKLRNGKE